MGPAFLLLGGLALLAFAFALLWPQQGLLARLRKGTHLSHRVLREDAIKYLHKAEARGEIANVDSLSGVLAISRDRAAGLVEEMTAGGLLVTEVNGLRLTAAGREAALHLIRAHRLWERYLSDETGYDAGEWHSRAEVQEHILTPEAAAALSQRLGNPSFDPHGDPIPAADGAGPVRSRGTPLSAIQAGSIVEVVHVEDEPAVVYAQLVAEGLFPGVRLKVVETEPRKIRFWANGEIHTLAPIVAQNLTVAPLPEAGNEEHLRETVPLSALALGNEGEVAGIAASCRGAERRRFLDLGLVPGTIVVPEMRSPGGDPTAYRVRETVVALRQKQAAQVRVRPINSGNDDR